MRGAAGLGMMVIMIAFTEAPMPIQKLFRLWSEVSKLRYPNRGMWQMEFTAQVILYMINIGT
jgi:hypothetical protein